MVQRVFCRHTRSTGLVASKWETISYLKKSCIFRQPTRESCMNIHSKPIAAYWAEVKEIVKEYDDMKERGEEFAETKFAYQARKALEAAEELRRRNIPYILPIEMHGRSGKNLVKTRRWKRVVAKNLFQQLLIDRLDAQIAEKMKGKKPIRRRRWTLSRFSFFLVCFFLFFQHSNTSWEHVPLFFLCWFLSNIFLSFPVVVPESRCSSLSFWI